MVGIMSITVGALVQVLGYTHSDPSRTVPAVFGWIDLDSHEEKCVCLEPGLPCVVVSVGRLKNEDYIRIMAPDGRLFYVRKSEVRTI